VAAGMLSTALGTQVIGSTIRPAIDGENLYLLYGGEGRRIGTVIDVYDAASGDYLHSFEVTKRAVSLAASGGKVALLQHEEGSYEILIYEFR
jgi:hypothetical protein